MYQVKRLGRETFRAGKILLQAGKSKENLFYNSCPISRALIGWFLSSKYRRIKFENSDLHALLYANELLVRVRLAFQKLYLILVFEQFRVLLLYKTNLCVCPLIDDK